MAARHTLSPSEHYEDFRRSADGARATAPAIPPPVAKLDSVDAAERVRPELARGRNGELRSTYEDALALHRSAFALSREDYVRRLRMDAANARTPAVAERFRLQAAIEDTFRAHDARLQAAAARAQPHAADRSNAVLLDRQRDIQAQQALLDLRSGSQHAATATARLDTYSREPRSAWLHETFQASSLRSTLSAAGQDAYDHARIRASVQLATRDGVRVDSYLMTQADADAFDRVFAAHFERAQRGLGQQAQQATAATAGRAAELGGLGQRAIDARAVPQPVAVAGYKAQRAADGRSVEYRRDGAVDSTGADFRDAGDRVTVSHDMRTDPVALRAALTVAAARFKRLSISGSAEFREAAVQEAVRMGLGSRIANPELKAAVERATTQQAQHPAPLQAQAHGTARASAATAEAARKAQGTDLPMPAGQAQERARQETALPGGNETSAGRGDRQKFPVTRMGGHRGQSAQRRGGSEEFPVTRMDTRMDTQSAITAARSQGGGRQR